MSWLSPEVLLDWHGLARVWKRREMAITNPIAARSRATTMLKDDRRRKATSAAAASRGGAFISPPHRPPGDLVLRPCEDDPHGNVVPTRAEYVAASLSVGGIRKFQTLPPERAQQPFTQGIRLGTAHRGFEHLQPQVAYALVGFLGEDHIAVMDEETVGVIRWDRVATCCKIDSAVGCAVHIGVQDTEGGVFHHDKHI